MAFSDDRRFLYVGYRGAPPQIASFAIEQDGTLTALGNAPIAAAPAYLSVSRNAVLGASYTHGCITLNPIAADGRALESAQTIDVGPKAHSILAWGEQVLVGSLGTDRVLAFEWAGQRLEAAGRLMLAAPTGSGPRHLAGRVGGSIYVVNELSATVDVYPPSGGTPVQSMSLLPSGYSGRAAAADIHLTPNGQSLFASERDSGTLTGFSVAADGRLTPTCCIATEREPRGFAIDPTGRFLVAAGTESQHLAVYAIGPGAMLSLLHRLPTGSNPNWIEIL
jgi:6-phosphogluconolactonase